MKIQNLKLGIRTGFTLVESLAVITFLTLISLMIGFFISQGYKYWNLTQKQGEVQEQIKVTLTQMAKNIREANTAQTGSYPIEKALPLSFIFYSNFDNIPDIERIRYSLEGTTLVRGIIKPSGSPPVYATSTETTKIVASYVRNVLDDPVFAYFDENYDGITNIQPLPEPVNIEKIRLIKINLTIDVEPEKNPPPYSLESEVNLRNLKTNL